MKTVVYVALAVAGFFTAAVMVDGQAAATSDRSVFCSEYVPNFQSESSHQKWLNQNPGERVRWEGFRDALCAGQNPTVPSMLTARGRGAVAAGKMALDEEPPPTTTSTTTTEPTTTTTTTEPPPPPPPPGDGNLWVDTNGGTCVRSSPPVAYSDATACATFDAAWDKAVSGDTIRVRAGTYPGQNLTGSKSAVTKIIGDPGVVIAGSYSGTCSYGPGTGLMQITAAFVWLENMRIDSGNQHGQGTGGCIDAANVTYRNVDLYGAFVSLYPIRPNFTWHGGNHGQPGVVGGARDLGDGEPVWIEDTADGTTLDGIIFHPKRIAAGFHMENVRVQSANGVTIRNSRFLAGSDAGSGHVFITAFSAGTTISGLTIEDTIFEPVIGTYAIQTHANVSIGQNWIVRRNRFDQPVIFPTQLPGLLACGNTGQVPASWQVSC